MGELDDALDLVQADLHAAEERMKEAQRTYEQCRDANRAILAAIERVRRVPQSSEERP